MEEAISDGGVGLVKLRFKRCHLSHYLLDNSGKLDEKRRHIKSDKFYLSECKVQICGYATKHTPPPPAAKSRRVEALHEEELA